MLCVRLVLVHFRERKVGELDEALELLADADQFFIFVRHTRHLDTDRTADRALSCQLGVLGADIVGFFGVFVAGSGRPTGLRHL